MFSFCELTRLDHDVDQTWDPKSWEVLLDIQEVLTPGKYFPRPWEVQLYFKYMQDPQDILECEFNVGIPNVDVENELKIIHFSPRAPPETES